MRNVIDDPIFIEKKLFDEIFEFLIFFAIIFSK